MDGRAWISGSASVCQAIIATSSSTTAWYTAWLASLPQVKGDADPAPQRIQDKHYMRKHGPNAYYGQGKH